MGKKKIISASRRTDIPGWYTPWFMDRIRQGYFTVINPFNRQARRVDATPDSVHTIVFWSKNIGPFLDQNAHKQLTDLGFHLYFNITVNPEAPVLEPGIPDLATRLNHLRQLCGDLDPSYITWRFDPICMYTQNGRHLTNAEGVTAIAETMGDMGIRRCVTSFYDPYKKVDRRIEHLMKSGMPKLVFSQPDTHKKATIVRKLADMLSPKGISLSLCCEKALTDHLETAHLGGCVGIEPNACIDGRRYKRLFGGNPETARDYGQRKEKGCLCTKSSDIGSYDQHPCHHNCLFCYARTGSDTEPENRRSQ